VRILAFYISASRAHLHRRLALAASTTNADESAEREDLARAMIHAQESAIIQILLEICDELPDDDRWILRQIRGIICSRIHDMFIDDPMLSKLVHFQTYPLQLIPIAVRGIASMHICIEFIPELLAHPSISKRVFAVILIAELSDSYPIQSSMSRARLAIDTLSTLLSTANIDECLIIFSSIISALAKIGRIFPPLSTDIAALMIRVGSMARCRLAIDGRKNNNRQESIEYRLIDLISNTFRVELCKSVLLA